VIPWADPGVGRLIDEVGASRAGEIESGEVTPKTSDT